ncbi:MAG: hypothetical protein DCC43_08355 [Candidatus Brocadia sp.]|nr:hypothetical protein [Candidatus Brocadia sp. AMX3]RIJ99441.1 MAG: hypothetical protein DCC43_08355 [Candidatus Brocadia sp.]
MGIVLGVAVKHPSLLKYNGWYKWLLGETDPAVETGKNPKSARYKTRCVPTCPRRFLWGALTGCKTKCERGNHSRQF